jgi:hypothetical protein
MEIIGPKEGGGVFLIFFFFFFFFCKNDYFLFAIIIYKFRGKIKMNL